MKKNIMLILAGLLLGPGCVKKVDSRVASGIQLGDIQRNARAMSRDITYYDTSPTSGRFPTGVAVARVIKQEPVDADRQAEALRIFPLESHEATYWAELFDGTPEVREVVMIHQNSVRREDVTIPELLGAAAILKTNLLLVYGYDNISQENACTVSGLLFDVPSGRAVVGLQHTMTLADAESHIYELHEEARPTTETDYQFYTDFLAFRGFEAKLRESVWQLIDRDAVSQELQPNPFANPRPPYPRTLRRPR